MQHFLFVLGIVAALVMAPVSPEAGNILFLIAGGLALLLLRMVDLAALGRAIIWMPLLALGLLGLAFIAGAGTFRGLEGVLPFAPVLAIWPLVMVARNSETLDPRLVAVFSFIGTAGALAIALNDYLLNGETRAGTSVANPIHFADVALLAGYLSLIGFIYVKSVWRFVFLSGPALSALTAILSGTRGAVVALVLMAVNAMVVAGVLRMIKLRVYIVAVVATPIVLLAGFAAGLGQTTGVQRLMLVISDVLQTGLPTGESTAIRLSMYQGGLNAFMASPIFGHGPFGFVDAAAASTESPLFVGAPHLHNDIFDFAASAGILGLVAYGLLMLAPLVEVLRAKRSAERNSLLVVVSTLVAGHFVMGLTNAMFGILTVTVYFATICVVVGVLLEPASSRAKANMCQP